MRRRHPPVPPEQPARLRWFDPADWGADPDGSDADVRAARDAWFAARLVWGRAHGLTPLDILRQGRNDRLRAAGQRPVDYGDGA